MNREGIQIRVHPVAEHEDGGTGHRWIVSVDFDGVPAYDSSAFTIESALAECVRVLAEALYDGSKA